MPLTVEQFSQRLTSSGVMSEDELLDCLAGVPAEKQPGDSEALARELVKQKKLTKFQAEQIYAGKEKSLTLGNYLILDKLGQGGMGMVLKALHRRMERIVALKVMSPAGMKSPDAVQRFQREVKAAAKLSHPHIVAAHDADEAKGVHFLVMEFVDGTDLSALVKKHGPLSVEQAIGCIVQAARGLEFAHSQGVIHRDMKPANLLIDAKGTVKILDMGLARIEGAVGGTAEGAGLTSTGTIMGTVDYMSPEQAMDTKHADARSDIYSLGCSLYYLLTGKAMYGGDTMMKKLIAHREAAIPDLSAEFGVRSAELSASLRTPHSALPTLNSVFQRMVAKKPSDRPQTMTQVIAELERCLVGGSATVALQPAAAAGSSASGGTDGNELQQFLREISGESATSSGGAASGATRPAEDSGAAETILSSADGAGTDPRSERTITLDRSGEPKGVSPRTRGIGGIVRGLTPAGSPKRILVGVAALVVILGIVFAMRGPAGTLQLEITDEQIEVTLGETKRTLRGLIDETVKLPLGEQVLHVQVGELKFDTPEITVAKGEPVAIKVERVGNRVRVMRDGEFFVAKELPKGTRAKSELVGAVPPFAKAPFDAKQARAYQVAWAKHLGVPVEYTNSIGMKFALIPPGEFMMGSTAEEIEAALKDIPPNEKGWQECIKSETPRHKVMLTQPIYLGTTEVTQAQYEKGMGTNPSHFSANGQGKEAVAGLETSTYPVENVRWNDAAEFCAKLSQQEKLKPFYFRAGETITPLDGTGYRLPTEAEWEFACRAGTATKYWIGDKDEDPVRAGWFKGNSGDRTHAAGELKANPFGLYDIHGNVWEWVQGGWEASWYSQFHEKPAINPSSPFSATSPRVFRGGGLGNAASGCRSSSRHAFHPTDRNNSIGFRVALPIDAVRDAFKIGSALQASTVSPKTWPADAPKPAIAPFDAKQARAYQEAWAKHLGTEIKTNNSIGQTMILIPPGEFLMGSTPEQIAAAKKLAEDEKMFAGDYYWTRHLEEAPQHPVTITQPFWMGRTEVTVNQFRKFVESSKYVTEAEKYGAGNTSEKTLSEKVKDADKGLNWKSPGYISNDETPVTQVTWNDACAYCVWLSEQEKRTPWYQSDGQGGWKLAAQANGYRLPTEAEWEYACRAGTTTLFSFGDDASLLGQYGWYAKNLDGKAQPVALKLPNPFGLYDVHGNAWEWCQDHFNGETYAKSPPRDPVGSSIAGTHRVLRGGYWTYHAAYCRSAYRGSDPPSTRAKLIGFRIVRVLGEGTAK